MPHKPPKKSAASNCAVPCAFTHAEIAIALPKMASESALHDISIVKSLSGIKTGPAPPPPRIHDWFAIHKI
jgi:hypothetical protein